MLSASEQTEESHSTPHRLTKTMAVSTFKISPALDDRNRARLESKTYARAYTDIPNKALPETYRTGLAAVFNALTGEEFDPESSTFTVRADANGTFKRLYSPTVFSTEEKGLVIRWGAQDIPLQAGDIIACGTSVGVGSMKPGSNVSIIIEGVGRLDNRFE